MRTRSPQYDLRGDTRKAKKWIPWAQQQLRRLKNLNAENPVNKVLRPVHGVAVYLKSVNAFDYIRIAVTLIVSKCNLTLTMTALGGKQVNFSYKYEFDDDPTNQTIFTDTGGLFLPGDNRYFASAVDSEGEVDTTKTFINTGVYNIISYAQANDVVVSHGSGIIDVPTYEVTMDVSSIAPKASLLVLVTAIDPIEVYANGELIVTLYSATHRTDFFTVDIDVVDSMVMRFVSTGVNIRMVAILFRQYDCLATDIQTITVT